MTHFSNRFSVGDTVVVKTEISATTGEIVDVTDLGITVEFDTQFSGRSLNFHPWSSVIYVNKTA